MIKKNRVVAFLFLVMLRSAVAQEDSISQDLTQIRQVRSCFASLNYFLTFIAEIVKYEGSSDEQSLKIVCSECKALRGSIEFLSSLIGTILKDSLDQEKFEILQPYAKKTLTLIKERDVFELNQLAVEVGNLLPITCHECKKSMWQLVDAVPTQTKSDTCKKD